MVKNLKKIVARAMALMVIASLANGIPVHVKAGVNNSKVVEGVTVTAKSQKGSNDVSKIIDGDKSTYWESSNHYRWVEIDLGGTYNLSEIKIFNKVNGYYNYNIYASNDGENFIKVADKADKSLATAEGDSHNLGNVVASKLRIDVTFSSESNDSNIAEVEIYGDKVSDKVVEGEAINVKDFSETKWATEYEKVKSNEAYANEKAIAEITNMVGRVIGDEYKDSFKFEIRGETSTGNDVFEVLDGNDGKILIRGNDGVSLASGFNYYLKNYCNSMYNPMMGSNINMPEVLPKVGEKIVIDTPYEQRYELNFCTYSYTMSFWDWDEYEAFLDWSAMNGFNLILDIIGQEEVLRRTLNEFGYSDEEVKEFISGPAYFAWFYMQNMTSFGGPLPNNWFEERAELGRKMHDRMQTYGISPVLQGYSGMVPLDFKSKNPEAQIISQGGWCGFDRPNMLRTFVNEGERDYFKEVAGVFYEKQKEVFGDVTDYYAVDPFHEGGNTGGLNDAKIYGTIQGKMIEHDKDAVWVIQNWGGNPSNSKLSGLVNKDQALVLDLNSDLNPGYSRFENQDIPWIWNMLHNFGGRMGIDGQPERVTSGVAEAQANSNYMKGIGITPEAINNSPIVYELIGDLIWTRDQIDFRQWTQDYIERRYGKTNDKVSEAWGILLETAYKKRTDYYQGAAESVVNSRPGFNINSASTWGHSKIVYDKKEFEKVVQLFIDSYDELKDSDAFIYDFVDVTKQVLSNTAQEYHKEMVKAYNDENTELFRTISNHFLELIKLEDRILSTSPEFLVGNWIEQSRTMLEGADDWTKDLFEFNSRALITTWGDYKNPSLNDYSNRQWAGLTGEFYYNRWKVWIDGLQNKLDNGVNPPNINWSRMEYEWVNKKTTDDNKYPTEGSGENLADLAKQVTNKYLVKDLDELLGGNTSSEEKENIALGKPVTSNVETNTNYPTTNLTDGSTGTSWLANGVTWPATLTLDLQGAKSVDGIQFAFNQAAGGFPIKYTVEVLSAGKWSKIAEHNDGNVTGTVTLDYKGTAEKIRINLNSEDELLVPELAEIIVYEGKEEVKYQNVALGKPVTGTTADSGRPLSNITDGREDTLWIAQGGAIPAEANIDLTGKEYIENVEVVFERPGLPFKFKVEVQDANGNKTIVLDKTNNTEILDGRYVIPVNQDITNIIVTITGKASVGQWPGAWSAIAEVKALRPVKETIESENVALDKTVIGSNSESGRPLSNITDGDYSTLWIANGGKFPAEANVNLGKEYFIDEIEVAFEKEGLPFKFKVEGQMADGSKEMILDMTNNNEVLDKIYRIPVSKSITNIIVTITGKAPVGNAQGAWPAIAEIKAFSKPENIAINSVVTPNEDGKMDAIIDGNEGTFAQLNRDDNKEYIIQLNQKTDIYAIEMIKSSNEPLKYKVEYTANSEEWITIIDKLTNQNNVDVNLDVLEKPLLASAIRVTYGNEELKLNELKIYKADVTAPLTKYIGEIQKIYDSAIVGEYSGNYTKEAKDTLGRAINAAKESVASGVNSDKVKEEIQKLKVAVNEFYKGYVVINRVKLASLISDVELVLDNINIDAIRSLSKKEKALVQSEIERLKEEKNLAIGVYEKSKVTQSEIDTAHDNLKGALNRYIDVLSVEEAFNTLLELAKSNANDAVVGSGNGQYPQEALDKFNSQIKKAEEDFKLANNKEEAEEIIEELKKSLEEFKGSVNEGEVEIIVGKPTNLKAESTAAEVKLTWNSPNEKVGLVSYVIYKDGKEIAEISSSDSEFICKELNENTIYGFKVASKYSNGEISKPVSVNVRTKKN